MESPGVMFDVLWRCAVFAGLFLIGGIPWALVRRWDGIRFSAAVLDTTIAGMISVLFGFVAHDWRGWWGSVPWTVFVVGIGIGGLLRNGRPRIARPEIGPSWAWPAAVVFGIATMIRLRVDNTISRGGDQGGYVNAANIYGGGSILEIGFPPLFPMMLGLASKLWGPAWTTSVVPLLGVLFLGLVLRVLGQLGVSPAVRLAALIFVAFQTHSVWYSAFPLSEPMQIVLVMMAISTFITVLDAPDARMPIGDLLWVFLVLLGVGMCRATGPLFLVPWLAVVAAALFVRSWRPYLPRVLAILTASTAGLLLAFTYGVDKIRRYVVELQIQDQLPASLFKKLNELRLLEPSPLYFAAMFGAFAVCAAATWLAWVRITRAAATEDASTDVTADEAESGLDANPFGSIDLVPRLIGVALVAITVLAAVKVDGREVGDQIARFGVVFLSVALVALLIPRALRGWVGLVSINGVLLALMMIVLTDKRLEAPRPHDHYLYWDRYLFSEAFPMAVLLAALTLDAVVRWIAPKIATPREFAVAGRSVPLRRLAAGAIPVLLALVAAGVALPQIRFQNAHSDTGGTYELLDRTNRHLDPKLPTVLAVSGSRPPIGFYFPNIWFAFGIPLDRTWKQDVYRPVLNSPFAADPSIDPDDIIELMDCTGSDAVNVVEVETGGDTLPERFADSGLAVVAEGHEAQEIFNLKQPDDGAWRVSQFSVNVYRVERTTAPVLACPAHPGLVSIVRGYG